MQFGVSCQRGLPKSFAAGDDSLRTVAQRLSGAQGCADNGAEHAERSSAHSAGGRGGAGVARGTARGGCWEGS